MVQRPVINPYWDSIQQYRRGKTVYEIDHLQRWAFCSLYSWSIPDPETVSLVAAFLRHSAVDMGAGTGYWSWLLSQMGVNMVAYDIAPPNLVTTNKWHSPYDVVTGKFLKQRRETFYPIIRGRPEVLAQCVDRTLFLCWPPYRSPMAERCLTFYSGSRLVYIGEDCGGGCATQGFFKKLEQEWRFVTSHDPVRWYRYPDRMRVYER